MSLKVDLDKDLEKRFRELAMKKYGYSKGSIKKAAESAIKKWTSEPDLIRDATKIRDPVRLMKGLLKEFRGKKSSVELQHEATKLWAKTADE